MYQHPDSKGKIGVELSRDLVKVAAKALTHNLTKLGPKVLPWSEKLLFAANWVGRKVSPGKWKEYVPDFREAFDHFCLHAGMTLPFRLCSPYMQCAAHASHHKACKSRCIEQACLHKKKKKRNDYTF